MSRSLPLAFITCASAIISLPRTAFTRPILTPLDLAPAPAAPWANLTILGNTSLVVTTPLWNLTLEQATGSFVALLDQNGTQLFGRSESSTLWSFSGPGASTSNRDATFAFSWSEGNATSPAVLAMTWTFRGQSRTGVAVSLEIPWGARWFDLAFALLSPPDVGASTLNSLWFPSLMTFNASEIEGVFYPQLPGVVLNASWFALGKGQNVPYPGVGTFIEMRHWTYRSGATVSLSTVSPSDYAIPHFNGFYPSPVSMGANIWHAGHSIEPINVTSTCDPTNGGWTGGNDRPSGGAPPCALGLLGTVRIRIAVGGTALQDTHAYAFWTGLLPPPEGMQRVPGLVVAAVVVKTLPPISEKLPRSLLQQLALSPMYKLDSAAFGLNFTAYDAIYDLLPVPGLVHYCAFEPVRFDRMYPDYLPPNPAWGSGCDLEAAMWRAKDRGHLMMPYSNPTWWDPVSPTLSHLPAGTTLADVTTLNASGQTTWENYADTSDCCSGVVMELLSEFMQRRWDVLMTSFSLVNTSSSRSQSDAIIADASSSFLSSDVASAASVASTPIAADDASSSGRSRPEIGTRSAAAVCNESAVRLPSDFIFEDQIGARPAKSDTHPLQGGLGALGFLAGEYSHAANYSNFNLATEQGVDKVAAHEWGFFGNAVEQQGSATGAYPWYDTASWTPLPTAPAIFGHSVLQHIHNLEGSAFAVDLPYACWAIATGARLSIEAVVLRQPKNSRWYASVGLFQRLLVSRWTGYPLVDYAPLETRHPLSVGSGASRSVFSNASAAPGILPLFTGLSGQYSVVTNWENVDSLSYRISGSSNGGNDNSESPPFTLSSSISNWNGNASFTLPPRACAAWGDGDDVVGGWFAVYNGRALPLNASIPAHAIIEVHDCRDSSGSSNCVYHPFGGDTLLDVSAPLPCVAPSTTPQVNALDKSGRVLGVLPGSTLSPDRTMVTFFATEVVGGAATWYFAVTCA